MYSDTVYDCNVHVIRMSGAVIHALDPYTSSRNFLQGTQDRLVERERQTRSVTRCTLNGKQRLRFREPRDDAALEGYWSSVKLCQLVLEARCQLCWTHTTRPSSIHPSTSIGTGMLDASFARVMVQAQRVIAMSMKIELLATCFPTQTCKTSM